MGWFEWLETFAPAVGLDCMHEWVYGYWALASKHLDRRVCCWCGRTERKVDGDWRKE